MLGLRKKAALGKPKSCVECLQKSPSGCQLILLRFGAVSVMFLFYVFIKVHPEWGNSMKLILFHLCFSEKKMRSLWRCFYALEYIPPPKLIFMWFFPHKDIETNNLFKDCRTSKLKIYMSSFKGIFLKTVIKNLK